MKHVKIESDSDSLQFGGRYVFRINQYFGDHKCFNNLMLHTKLPQLPLNYEYKSDLIFNFISTIILRAGNEQIDQLTGGINRTLIDIYNYKHKLRFDTTTNELHIPIVFDCMNSNNLLPTVPLCEWSVIIEFEQLKNLISKNDNIDSIQPENYVLGKTYISIMAHNSTKLQYDSTKLQYANTQMKQIQFPGDEIVFSGTTNTKIKLNFNCNCEQLYFYFKQDNGRFIHDDNLEKIILHFSDKNKETVTCENDRDEMLTSNWNVHNLQAHSLPIYCVNIAFASVNLSDYDTVVLEMVFREKLTSNIYVCIFAHADNELIYDRFGTSHRMRLRYSA